MTASVFGGHFIEILVELVDAELLGEVGHFNGAACAVAALHVDAFLALLVVFRRQHAVGDGNVVVKTDARVMPLPDSLLTSSKW